MLITDCVATNNWEEGFDIGGHTTPASTNGTFRNCVSYNNAFGEQGVNCIGFQDPWPCCDSAGEPATGCTGDDGAGFKIAGWDTRDTLIENSLGYGNAWAGANTDCGSVRTTFNNFTSWNNREGMILDDSPVADCVTPTGNTIKNSVLYPNAQRMVREAPKNTNTTLDWNLYFSDFPDTSPAWNVSWGSFKLNQWTSYLTAGEGQCPGATDCDANSPTPADPLFVNTADPDGADNTFMTCDDGLLLQAGSPGIGAASDGGNLGYRVTGCGTAAPSLQGASGNFTLTRKQIPPPQHYFRRMAIQMDKQTVEENVDMLRAWIAYRKEHHYYAGWDYACMNSVGHCPESHRQKMLDDCMKIGAACPSLRVAGL